MSEEFTLDGKLSELSRLSGEIERFCAFHALGEEPKFQLLLGLDELFTNAVRHGGCAGIAAVVRIRLEAKPGVIAVQFLDRGVPFDPLSVPPPDLTAPLEQRARGGLGLHFVRHIMRNMQYDRCGEWNRLTMEYPL